MIDFKARARPWPADPAAAEADRQKRTALARDIWSCSLPAAETVVERYLRGRAITIPIPATIGFLPQGDRYAYHPWSGERRPVMVAAVEHVEHGITAVHRTWLALDGSSKATISPPRVTTGPIGGGAVRLGEPRPDAPLVIGEGLESALAAMELTGWPAWAALSAIGIEKLRLPAEVRDIAIFADRDPDGIGVRCARRAAARWVGEGRRCRVVIPDRIGTDANDLLREARHAA